MEFGAKSRVGQGYRVCASEIKPEWRLIHSEIGDALQVVVSVQNKLNGKCCMFLWELILMGS